MSDGPTATTKAHFFYTGKYKLLPDRVIDVMERKALFSTGAVWEKVGENNSEVHVVNVENRNWDEWVSKADWNDDAIYSEA